MLREAFALPSLTCEVVPGGEGFGDHLIWRTAAPGRPIVLVGHHDTVFPQGHFEGWREEAGRATGPGALDMKGGLAIIHAALSAFEATGLLAKLPVVVVCVPRKRSVHRPRSHTSSAWRRMRSARSCSRADARPT